MWYRIQRLVLPLLPQASTASDNDKEVEMLRRLLAERKDMVAQLQADKSKDKITVCSVVASCGGQRL